MRPGLGRDVFRGVFGDGRTAPAGRAGHLAQVPGEPVLAGELELPFGTVQHHLPYPGPDGQPVHDHVDGVLLALVQLPEKSPRICRKGFNITSLTFDKYGVERQT